MVVHTETCQHKVIWNLIQQNSEDNYEFSSAEKRALNTNTHRTLQFYGRKIQGFSLPRGFRVTVELVMSLMYYNPLAA